MAGIIERGQVAVAGEDVLEDVALVDEWIRAVRIAWTQDKISEDVLEMLERWLILWESELKAVLDFTRFA